MTREKISDKFRLREIDRSDAIQTLLNSLTLEGIREAAYLLAPTKKVRIRGRASSYDDLLETNRPTDDIIKALLQVEAQTPFKHVLVARAQEPSRAFRLETKLRESISAGGFNFLVRLFLRVGEYIYITLEHSVTVREWVEGESEDVRKVRQYDTRHPIVVRISLTTAIALICFPGFSQGTATKRSALIGY